VLTLLLTVLATAYFVVPELLTRFVVSFYFVRKAQVGTRSEEILRSAFWAVVPLMLAWSTRHIGWWTVPQGITESTRTVFTGLYSDKRFEQNPAAFYAAFSNFLAFNACLLVRTYGIVIAGSALFGWIALHLGTFRVMFRRWPRVTKALHWAFMPRISEWDIALSSILIHAPRELIVRIDVMTKGGILYRGNVFEKRITASGDLGTLILQNAQRMVREDFTRDRTEYEHRKSTEPKLRKPNTENYWRRIPGELFLLNGSEISSVNVRHVRPVGILKPNEDEELLKAFAALNQQLELRLSEREP
jgi:hypothetical protein